jgi:glutamate synthase domain-containing protein 2
VCIGLVVGGVIIDDVVQRKHAILRNYPVLGHFRYLFEAIGSELRQYMVTSNNEERPFSRDQRSWIYASSKSENNYSGFGTDDELELSPNYTVIKHSAFPLPSVRPGDPDYDERHRIPSAKVLGRHRRRRKAFRPSSIFNVSGMSYGSLSGAAVEALNRGTVQAECLHNTGEGGVSLFHQSGGELIWQIGTGYFGCRDEQGRFSMERFRDTVAANPIRAIEIKLSQGAKRGLGDVLLGKKVTEDIAKARGIPVGQTCASPNMHSAFTDVDSMLDFVETLADVSGLSVGIKSAVGDVGFWKSLVRQMAAGGRGVDFVTVDGGEGGTGAAPMVFADHVSLPFKNGFSRVYREFAEQGLHENVVFIGSGKRNFPESAVFAFALGCDMIAVAREAMMSIGCIQAQRCHTGHCPAGIATQNKWLMGGLDLTLKADRFANYICTLRKEIAALAGACGVGHPAFLSDDHIEILDGRCGISSLFELFGYRKDWGLPSREESQEIRRLMPNADSETFSRLVETPAPFRLAS